jgi:protein NrfD
MIGVLFTYNVPHLLYWDWRIAADLFFGGIGVGAFLLAVVNSLYYKDKYVSVSKIGAILSPLLVILGLIFLLTELGHPLRMWRTVPGFNISSPLSWGGPFQGLFIGVGIVYAYLWIKPGSVKLRNIVGVVGIPLALVVGAYHGWLLTIVRARPLWNTGPATISALLCFVTTGMAAVLLVLCLLPKSARQSSGASGQNPLAKAPPVPWMIRDFRHLLVVAMIVQALVFFIWWISLYYGPTDAREALITANAAIGSLFWIVGIGLGLIIPIFLQVLEIVRHSSDANGINIPLTIVTTVLILVGGFVFRYAVVIGGQLS